MAEEDSGGNKSTLRAVGQCVRFIVIASKTKGKISVCIEFFETIENG